MKRLGVYIHIPFCASKCGYCDFYSLSGCEYLMPEYHKALLSHIRESAESLLNYEVDSIYFGGGTPSFYGADRIVEILDALKENGNVRTDSEITVECNPDSISANAMTLLAHEGVNRLSLGVQATDNNLLKLIGRRHNFQQAEKAILAAREAGFANLSLDLMYGLPSQSRKDWADTLAKILSYHPEHLSCYGLKLEEGTPMYARYKGSPILPDDDEQADMYHYACDMLRRYGYRQYEISNFCAPGFESRHNLKYWKLDDYMGFGPGAHSCVGNLRYSFVKDLRRYITGVHNGQSLTDEYKVIDFTEKSMEYIMLAMRTDDGISEFEYRERTRSDWKLMLKVLMAFRGKGWAEEKDGRWHFTVSGWLVSNTLIEIMIEVLATKRLEGLPWVQRADTAERKISIPMSDDERFINVYRPKKDEVES